MEYKIIISESKEKPGTWLIQTEGRLDLLTEGSSPADALEQLSEVFRLVLDECEDGNKHCWCRQSDHLLYTTPETPHVECCYCGMTKPKPTT